jgi:TonB-dependent receptor
MTILSPSKASRLCLLASVAAAVPTLAFAQTAEPTAEADTDANEIVVTGSRPIAESEAAALAIQRASDSLVSVAAADSIGRLPDQNIAQAASRLPGIGIERDQGQARYISLRGAPNYWTTLSFDGVNVVSPEGRDARYDSIPSAIASQIIVSKAVTPDMSGETISGNVNIVTRSAFDYGGFRVSAKLGGGYVELGGRQEYEGSLVVSNVFDTQMGEIGLVVSGSYYQRDMITDNFETDWEIPLRGDNSRVDQRPGFEDRYWARETENKLYRLTRKNYSVSGRLDFRPDADNRVSLRSIYTIFTDDEARDNYIFDFDDRQNDLATSTAACPAVASAVTTSAYADACANTPFRGTVYGIDINQRSTLRAFRQSVFTNTIEGEHKFGDSWKFKWLGNFTKSKDDRSIVGEVRWDSPSTRTARPTVSYDFTNPNLARVQLFTTLSSGGVFSAGIPVTAIDSFVKPLTTFRNLDAVDTTNAYTVKAEISRGMDLFGGEGTIRFGMQYDERTKQAVENELVLNTAAVSALGLPTTYDAFSLSTPFKGEIPLGYSFRYFDTQKMRDYLKAGIGAAARTPVLGNQYKVTEEVYAAYLMATVKFDWGSIVGGARVEHIKNRGEALGTIGATANVPIVAEASQTLVYPSLHINYNVADDKKLRLSFNSGAARADYDQLRPNLVINDANQTISGGNPAIKPERAYGVDAYFEWYVKPQGYFSVGLFYKRVEDVLYNSRRTFGSDALNIGGVDRSQYAFSGIINGGKGYIYGAEAALQLQLEPWTGDLGLPEWMGGFGISTNLTLNKSRVSKPAVFGATPVQSSPARKLRLPGTSDYVFNVGPYYEKYGLSIRLSYQKRSEWLDSVGDTLTDAGDQYWAADDEMDFSARYAISKAVEVYFDASNLLNNPGRRYAGVSARTIEWERFGRRYTGGVRVTF